MTEADNKNYSTIEEQFKIIRDYIVREEDPRNLLLRYDKLDINKNLKEGLKGFGATITATLFLPIADNAFHCLNKEKNKKELINFIFGFDQNNLDTFLNNEQIDAQDKFSALITKYAIISQLPDEFKDTRDKEMDLLYNNNIEKVSKDCANYIEKNGLIGDKYVFLNSLTQIIGNIFSNDSKTDYNKDIKFITDIYKNIPLLTKDRVINFQGQPGFNKIIERFLMKPCKSNDMLNFFKYCIEVDPSCIYKFSTTQDNINQNYEQIEQIGDFSGNFICNFPNALDGNGEINCEETRCQYNILSDILYTLKYVKFPEDVKEDVIKMLNCVLESLPDHIRSLKNSENKEELQKINYLLNCPIEDPNTEEIVTPMDLINNFKKQGIINITEEQIEQFRSGDPVCLQTVEEVKNSIEFKKAVAKKQKEEKMKETQIDLNADGYMERIFLSKEEKEEQKRLKDKEESIPLNEYRTMEEIFTPEVLQREIIEEQFKIIRDYIIGEKDPGNLLSGYDELNISNDLKIQTGSSTGRIINMILFNPILIDAFPFLNNKNIKNKFINFVFNIGQNNFDTFLNDEQINVQDKFSALVTKYLIISSLPEEFVEVKNEEMDLLYNHIKEVSEDYTKYIETEKIDVSKDNLFIFSNSLQIITSNILFKENKTDYNKDIRFITDIYQSLPILTKDRTINFQGEPSFNILLQKFLEKPHKNDDIFNFFKDTIKNDPTCIYKFATTIDNTNRKYEQIEKNKDFSGNFICNFPNALNENGEINCEETRCKYNVLSDILYTLNYKELPEDVREDVKQMANLTLESLSNHIKFLRENNNLEELQKINYLLNCPIEDPNTEEIVTPMDLINNLRKKGIINLTEEQMEQFRTESVCLQTVEEVKNSIEFKKAVAKKQKEEKMKETQIDLNADGYMERIFLSKEEKEEQKRLKDKEESIPLNEYRTMEEIFTPEVLQREVADKKETIGGNKEIEKLQNGLEAEKQRTKASRTYKFYNFFSKTFLKRETKYRTKSEILAEKKLNEKIIELSRPFFSLATKATEKQIQTLNQNISKEQTRGTEINNSKSIENRAI